MLRVLLKKQFMEMFKGYFYNAKKNKMRSKFGIVAFFLFFILIMAGFLGGVFTFVSIQLCDGLTSAGMDWMYFLIVGSMAILLGAFGSVFTTYASLYLSKDNDLLLSMPIPVRTIISSRLMNVWLMGTMYVAVVLIPAIIVYWIQTGPTTSKVICGIMLFVIVTVIVLILSCLLGWVVAKISLKMKNKSAITTIVSLVFIVAYYAFYYRANAILQNLLVNAQVYGEKIKGAAYGLYLFGKIGTGDWLTTAIFTLVFAVLLAVVWTILTRSFLSIATSTGKIEKKRYVEKTVKQKSPFGALLHKEFSRFTSSSNYMLNCGLGILMVPIGAVGLLLKGREVCELLDSILSARPGLVAVILCAALCMIATMIDPAAPSVSLEGKNLWIPQSLPVETKTVLRAKMCMQLILGGIPMAVICLSAAIVVPGSVGVKVFVFLMPMAFTTFLAVYGMFIGIKMPLLNWTNETAPIKQGGAVTIALLSSWAMCVAIGVVYGFFGYKIKTIPYLGICTALFAVLTIVLLRWQDTKGAREFQNL